MRIFVYEFVTGGGWYAPAGDAGDAPPDSLVREGRAMLAALAADFAAIDGTEVDVLGDVRQPRMALPGVTVHAIAGAADEKRAIARLAAEADWTVLIAPEFDGHLLQRTRAVHSAGGRLLSPPAQVVALAGDKQATAEHLARHGVNVPRGVALEAGQPFPSDFPFPAVLKPRDGAGSLGIEWIAERPHGRVNQKSAARLEAFCPGTAVSVACLCGSKEIVPLEPCRQHLAGDGDFAYLGGSLPIELELARRARRLAVRAAGSLPNPLGYVGLDLILGNDPAGSGDFVVEINPRLTTSYVGLRALSRINLAQAMVRVADGVPVELCWNSREIHFTSGGVLA